MPTAIDHKERQKAQWSGAAAAWDRRFDWYSTAFGPLFTWCCDATGLAPGMRVLDVACGSGQPAVSAAARVGRSGTVTAIDLSPEMVERSRRRVRAAGLTWVSCEEMDAEHLRFPDASFDAVTCGCGLMFLPDAAGAVREMTRVLRPGGRLAVSVWDEPSRSPFLTAAGGAVAQFFPPAPPDPNAPAAFRFSRPADLEAVLRAGGVSDITVESRPITIELASSAEYWDVFTDMAAGIKEKIAPLAAADLERLRALVDDAVRPSLRDGRLHLTATLLCASGRK